MTYYIGRLLCKEQAAFMIPTEFLLQPFGRNDIISQIGTIREVYYGRTA